MSNELQPSNKHPNLPAKIQSELNALRTSPEKYYAELRPIKPDEPLTDTMLTLSNIQNGLGAPQARLAVSIALIELAEWFNVQRNLTDRQIAMIADMIVETHWDLSLNDLKGCFQKMMRTAKLYGKLDGSDILQFLDSYKQDCIEAKQKQLEEEAKQFAPSERPITYEEWCAKTPKEKNYLANGRSGKPPLTDEEKAKKEADFQRFRREYLTKKGITPK